MEENTDDRGKYEFEKDIILGEKGELIIRNYLLTLPYYTYLHSNKDYRYDLMMSYKETPVSYEIKTDVYKDTGNMLIEFESRGKPSGIKKSEAKIFVYFYYHLKEAWRIATDDLKTIIKANDFLVVNCGDYNSETWGYLIPRDFVKDSFVVRKVPISIF